MTGIKQFSQQLLKIASPRSTKKKQNVDDENCVHTTPPTVTTSPKGCQQTTIEELPIEVLRIILSELLLGERVAFSLVSKKLWTTFGDEYKLHVKDKSSQRSNFLLLLEHDLPDHLMCYTCVKLYRWQIPGESEPRLCPGRKLYPHFSYGHLDVQHHERRVEREIIDLVCRGADNPGYGLPASFLLKILREKDKFDRHLTLPISSLPSLISYYNSTLVVKTQTEVRIPGRYWNRPDPLECLMNLAKGGPHVDLRHGTVSSIFRWFGASLHEAYEHKYLSKGSVHDFYLCLECHSSVRVARRSLLGRTVFKVDTAQCFGNAHELLGDDERVAGLRRHHQKNMPRALVNIMTCADSPSKFAVQPALSNFTGQVNAEDYDLSVYAWLWRHNLSYQQRLWPAENEGEWGEFDSSTGETPVIGPDGICEWPMISNTLLEEYLDEWEDSYIPLRKRWLIAMYYNTKDGIAQLYSKLRHGKDDTALDEEDEDENDAKPTEE